MENINNSSATEQNERHQIVRSQVVNEVTNTSSVEPQVQQETEHTAEVWVKCGSDVRKPAFARGINRPTNMANVKVLANLIKNKGYREGEEIQVFEPETTIDNVKFKLVDITGKVIPETEWNGYYLVGDGQHRVHAVQLLMPETEEFNQFHIPAVLCTLKHGETFAEYLEEINKTKLMWGIHDFVTSAANVNPENQFLERFTHYMKKENGGFPITTLNLIYFNSKSVLTKSTLMLLCSKETVKGKKQIPIIPEGATIHNGDIFIETCQKAGFSISEISHRYLIDEYLKIAVPTHDYKLADRIFSAITTDDIAAMKQNGKLSEEKVKEQINLIRQKIQSGQ